MLERCGRRRVVVRHHSSTPMLHRSSPPALQPDSTPLPPMIIDLQRFIATERKHWAELESLLDKLESDPGFKLDLEQLKHFHHHYERTSADLAKVATFA